MTHPSPSEWTDQQWMAFILLEAAYADQILDLSEHSQLSRKLGKATLAEMQNVHLEMTEAARADVMREWLPKLFASQQARGRLQRALRDIFLADGEYGQAEQALLKKISGWIRGE